jgi:hypothetical protein
MLATRDCQAGLAISWVWAHIGNMAKSIAGIRLEAQPMKSGHHWRVVVAFPDGPELNVNDFKTEADAKNWITNHSQAWLKEMGYAHE